MYMYMYMYMYCVLLTAFVVKSMFVLISTHFTHTYYMLRVHVHACTCTVLSGWVAFLRFEFSQLSYICTSMPQFISKYWCAFKLLHALWPKFSQWLVCQLVGVLSSVMLHSPLCLQAIMSRCVDMCWNAFFCLCCFWTEQSWHASWITTLASSSPLPASRYMYMYMYVCTRCSGY